MAKLVLWLIIGIVVLVISKRTRAIIFHVHVRRFFLIVMVVGGFTVAGIGGYLAWKYWWPLYMATPTVEYYDQTLEEDLDPTTPGTGGPATPVIIQTR
jgi:hypothetical protein